MTEIIGNLDTRRVGRDQFKLLSSVSFILNSGLKLIAHKGLIYDSGSIPSLAYSFVGCPFGSEADFGYLFHDKGYRLSRQPYCPFTRKEIDDGLLEIHQYCGVNSFRALTIYNTVRGHSWRYWGDGNYDLPSDDFDDPFWDG